MTTALNIVLNAFRDGNLVPLDSTTGIPVVNDGEKAEGLSLLNRYIDSLYGLELGEFNFDWPIPPTIQSPVPARFPIHPKSELLASNVYPYPPGNVRILLNLVADTTIYMPQSPDNGARYQFINIGPASTFILTVIGNTRLVKGVQSFTGTATELNGQRLLYRSDLGDWTLIDTLLEASESPLAAVYDDLLSIGTFQRLAPRYGRSLSPELIDTRNRLMKRLKAEFRQKVQMPSANPNPFFLPSSDINRNGATQFGGRLF